MSEWISIEEKWPEDSANVWVTDGRKVYAANVRNVIGGLSVLPVGSVAPSLMIPTHWMPLVLPAPPVQRLTAKEALGEAVCQLETIFKMCRRHDGERFTDSGGYYIESPYISGMACLLLRLRAALEAE